MVNSPCSRSCLHESLVVTSGLLRAAAPELRSCLVPVSVPLPLSSCELPCRHVHETKGPPAFRVRPSIGLFLEPDETGIEKPSERFSRQAVGCAQDVGVAPLATAHDISSTPPRLKPPLHGLHRRRLLTSRCTPVRGLNSFFSFRVQCPKGNFQLRDSDFAQAARERSTKRSTK
jgi:hypothetical protein